MSSVIPGLLDMPALVQVVGSRGLCRSMHSNVDALARMQIATAILLHATVREQVKVEPLGYTFLNGDVDDKNARMLNMLKSVNNFTQGYIVLASEICFPYREIRVSFVYSGSKIDQLTLS